MAALCSMALTKTRRLEIFLALAQRASPKIASALASVAPLVKMISLERAPIKAASSARAVSTAWAAARPIECDEWALAN